MNPTFKAAVAALVFAGAITEPVTAEPREEGMAAYRRGDYVAVLRLWRPLADQGEPFVLGDHRDAHLGGLAELGGERRGLRI